MRFTVLSAAFLTIAAAPPPKEADAAAIRRHWGTIIDPKQDCTIKVSGNQLVVKVPASPHEYDSTAEVFQAPRVLQDVTGDFEATVAVHPANLPLKAKQKSGMTPTATAGLLLTNADGKFHAFVAVERLVSQTHNRQMTFGIRLHHPPGGREAGSTPRDADAADLPVRLKLTRAGSSLTMAVTFDGKAWHTFDESNADWPADLKLGVFVAHDTDRPFEAGFEDLKIVRRQ